MPRRPAAASIRLAAAVLTAGVVLGLVACAPAPTAAPTPAVSTTRPPAGDAAAPVPAPTGSAADNLPLFQAVTAEVWAESGSSSGRAYVDALVAAGFDKSAMQVTADLSTVGNPAESVQFSVRWGDEACLIGQVGPSTGDPVTEVVPQLADGRCLVGQTRPIDW